MDFKYAQHRGKWRPSHEKDQTECISRSQAGYVQDQILLKYQHAKGSENSCSACFFLDIGCCCGFSWGVPPSRSTYVMAPPVIHNTAWLCKVIHCCSGTVMGSGPRGEMPQRYCSPGPLRQTSDWERRVSRSSVYNSTPVWYALP